MFKQSNIQRNSSADFQTGVFERNVFWNIPLRDSGILAPLLCMEFRICNSNSSKEVQNLLFSLNCWFLEQSNQVGDSIGCCGANPTLVAD
jgi:hypothetical protein